MNIEDLANPYTYKNIIRALRIPAAAFGDGDLARTRKLVFVTLIAVSGDEKLSPTDVAEMPSLAFSGTTDSDSYHELARECGLSVHELNGTLSWLEAYGYLEAETDNSDVTLFEFFVAEEREREKEEAMKLAHHQDYPKAPKHGRDSEEEERK